MVRRVGIKETHPDPSFRAMLPHLHQVWGHHAPGPHHVEQRSVLVPDDPQHGLAQTEEMEGAASLQRRLGLSYRHTEGTKGL